MPSHDWFHIGNDGRGVTIIYIYDEIPTSAEPFFAETNSIPALTAVTVFINSMGGDLFTGLAIANTIRTWQSKGARVVCEVSGVCGSAVTLIAAAADEVKVSEGGFLLFHRAKYTDERADDERAHDMNDAMARRLAAKAGCGKDRMLELMASESWVSAREAADLGFADTIIGEARI